MDSSPKLKSIGLIWTTYHYYLGEIASLLAESQTSVTVYIYFESAEEPARFDGVTFKNMSNIPLELLKYEIQKADHDSVVICGWHINFFRVLARELNAKVFLFMDNPWRGTLRQYFGCLFFRLFWLRNYEGAVVPGILQKKFALHLGFKEYEVQMGFFSFLKVSVLTNSSKFPTREFIFIGRLISLKGILELAHAYTQYRLLVNNPWPLIICGEGVLLRNIEKIEGIQLKGFLSKESLFDELKRRRVFISCGIGEHWGISIYESAFFGHPLIVSADAGSASTYLKSGINGISIKGRNSEDILNSLMYFHGMTDSELESFSKASAKLARNHDTEYFKTKVIPFLFNAR